MLFILMIEHDKLIQYYIHKYCTEFNQNLLFMFCKNKNIILHIHRFFFKLYIFKLLFSLTLRIIDSLHIEIRDNKTT